MNCSTKDRMERSVEAAVRGFAVRGASRIMSRITSKFTLMFELPFALVLLPVFALVFALAHAANVAAQSYPVKPIRIIVGFAPAGAADVVIRVVAQGLSTQMGQSVVVDNRPGADSTIAAEAVAKAPADGYTLFLGSNTALVAVPTSRATPYDPFADFTPISNLGRFTMFLAASPNVPASNVRELIDYARSRPGQLNYATSNRAAHLATVQLLAPSKLEMTHVRYKGDAQAINDLMTDRIQIMWATGTGVPPLAKEGKLRVLATLLDSRSPLLPDVPTAKEAGLQRLTIVPWAALFAPARLAPELTARLSREVATALKRADVREQLDRQGFEPSASTSDELAQFHRLQHDNWTRTVREQNIKFD